MKKLILIVFLSFLVLSCTKEDNKIKNQTRIKNDMPKEMMGKWKIISEESGGPSREDDGKIVSESNPYDTRKEYDIWIKEYSICCVNEEEGCDEFYYKGEGNGEAGTFTARPCDSEKGYFYSFYHFSVKEPNIVLIGESYGDGWGGYRYKKVE